MYKVVFSDKQFTEIKKKMHIDPIFTYSDSEIALKVCRNNQRFKFNCRSLCVLKEKFDLFEKFPTVFGDPSLQNGVHCQKFVTNRDSLCVPREGTESEVDSGYKLGRAGSEFFLPSERTGLEILGRINHFFKSAY